MSNPLVTGEDARIVTQVTRDGGGPRVRLTLLDIARMAGVSRTTASRVLNDRGEVSPEVRDRVHRVIEETGYRPLATARSLVSHRTGLIGFVVPIRTVALIQDPYFVALLQGLSRATAEKGFATALFLFDDEADQDGLVDRVVGPRRVDGMIVSAYHTHDSLLDRLADYDMPTVTMGPNSASHVIGSVAVDNRTGGRLAGEHLLSLGCQRIALIGGPENTISGADRSTGFVDALTAGGLDLPTNLRREGDYTEKSGQQLAESLVGEDFDGIFVASDMMAIGAMRAFQARGLRVPQDVAVVGFDDLPNATSTNPPLTTVAQPITAVADAALDLLLDQIDDPSVVRHLVLPVNLVERASTNR